MSLITRNAKEYRSMTAQLMSQNLPIVSCSFGIFCVLRHPNHFVLAGTNNRNVIVTYRFLDLKFDLTTFRNNCGGFFDPRLVISE